MRVRDGGHATAEGMGVRDGGGGHATAEGMRVRDGGGGDQVLGKGWIFFWDL